MLYIIKVLRAVFIPRALESTCQEYEKLKIRHIVLLIGAVSIAIEWFARYGYFFVVSNSVLDEPGIARTVAKVFFEKTMWVLAMLLVVHICTKIIKQKRLSVPSGQIKTFLILGFGCYLLFSGVYMLGLAIPFYSIFLLSFSFHRIAKFNPLISVLLGVFVFLVTDIIYIFISGVVLYGPEYLLRIFATYV